MRLTLHNYSADEIREIQRACCRLFMTGEPMHAEIAADREGDRPRYPFIEQMGYDEVRQAYRENIFAHHPDRHQDKSEEVIAFYSRHVEELNRSYEYLSAFFEGRKPGPDGSGRRRNRIIAVGGGKGGIGKSIFAANLGMVLSSLGFRTAMVDLDLGGSDLHIYLGHKRIPETTLNDFLNRKIASLDEAAVGSSGGPVLIAGDCGELGAANIAFQKKLRLLESIRRLDADYVILDLGAGTDFNTLDFFLGADLGIVLSTLDQSSYLEAYAFLKTSLQRKLNRLFMSDSTFPGRRNPLLRDLVAEGTKAGEMGNPRSIRNLLDEVAQEDPLSLPLITDEILDFKPCLVVNHCFDQRAAARVASTLRSVACQRLCLDIRYAGTISRSRAIEQSTSYAHHPLVSRNPAFAAEITHIVRELGLS